MDNINPGQQKFFDFIMDRVQEDKQDEAQALLEESFAKQADGTFNAEYLATFAPRMIVLLKPEAIEEVKGIMAGFGPK